MKWTIKLVEEKNHIRVGIEGYFDSKDHLEIVKDILSQKYWKPGMNVLIDSREVDYSKANVDVMRQAGENMSRFDDQIGTGKAAVLMGSVLDFGKGRQFELLPDEKVSANVTIFLDENRALDWLDAS